MRFHDTGVFLFDTAIGRCGLAWNARAVTGVRLPDASDAAMLAWLRRRGPAPAADSPALDTACAELPPHARQAVDGVVGLLRGAKDPLWHIELDMDGVPPFHRDVYACARRIVPGQTATYGEIARQLGEPGAARAVGQALGANPFAPVIPCHRVLAAGSRSGGFSAPGGVPDKLRMLLIERAAFGAPGLFDDDA